MRRVTRNIEKLEVRKRTRKKDGEEREKKDFRDPIQTNDIIKYLNTKEKRIYTQIIRIDERIEKIQFYKYEQVNN